MKIYRKLFIVASLTLLGNCVEEIDLGRPTPAEFIVVDAILNYHELADSSDLVVRLSVSSNQFSRPVSLEGATIELIVDDKDRYSLEERSPGIYYLFSTHMFQVGAAYKLRFQSGSEIYESSNEILPGPSTITSAYGVLNPNGDSQNAFEIFVDMQDDPAQKNYYRWLITQWEKQLYCLYCYGQFRAPEVCRQDLYGSTGSVITRNPLCNGNCYDIIRFSPNNAISDIFTNGKQLIKKSIGFVPLNFYAPCLIEVKQSSLTPQYFAFLETLRSQAENTGGLADTPPALLTGNVKNLNNPDQKVVGYFSVTNNAVKRFMLNRAEALQYGIVILSSLNPPIPQPTPAPPSWYPLPCIPSPGRTPEKPRGWVD